MSKISFLFIALAFFLLPFEVINSTLYEQVESICCASLIATFGISHGAIDNHLYGFKNTAENIRFIGFYIFAALVFAALWYVNQNLAFLIFIIISAYHFGQSQFADLQLKNRLIDRLLYTTWGIWLLMSFIYLNQSELASSYNQSDLNMSTMTLALTHSFIGFVISSVVLLIVFVFRFFRKEITAQRVLLELYQAFLILVVFKISSPLLAFTLYFVVLHSGRVLNQEFNYLILGNKIKSLKAFIQILMPFTLISIIGLVLFAVIVYKFKLDYSWPLVAIIFISCLTFPHSFVMDWFYQKSSTQAN